MMGMTGRIASKVLPRRAEFGADRAGRCRCQAGPAEPALGRVVVVIVGVIAVVVMTMRRLRHLTGAVVQIRHVRVHSSTKEQLRDQNNDDGPTKTQHGEIRYASHGYSAISTGQTNTRRFW